MTGDDLCRCGHERKWHNACSKCMCPFFLDVERRAPAGVQKLWRAAGEERARKEAS